MRINNSFYIVGLILLFLAAPVYAQINVSCGIKNKVINPSESLTFKVFYNLSAAWVPAGEAVFTTKLANMQGRPAYHIVGTGRTYSSYDWIFKVRDTYETYIDTANLYPLRFIRNVNEGGYKFTNDVVFYQDIKKAVSKGKSFTVPNCIQDVLSTIYYARNIDYKKFKPGDKIPFSLFLDDEVHNIYIRYIGKEKITTRYGVFNAIKIAPLLIEGTIFKGGEKMAVWVTDDENRIPVRIDSPILVGSIKVDLVKYNNLKYPLTSLIKKI